MIVVDRLVYQGGAARVLGDRQLLLRLFGYDALRVR